ncbi:hypothetical protein VH79_20975 [Salmonella enterica]|uniref:Uncharacterized protein n=1 Tax=Salmonella enterica TaxID=28901 RepID=A0A5U3IP26_SALER|nr:hypothetical protein [Salmonella enterica]EEH4116098.1 hypothetical protein [Salmonella enterica subsp. enterica serovar Hvittingfoss]
MATRRITATREWQQITDGHETVVIQFTDPVEICDNAVKPDIHMPALYFKGQTLTISPPTHAWIRSAGSGIYNEIPVVVMDM